MKKNYSGAQLFSWRAVVQTCSRAFLNWKPLLLLALFLTSLQTFAYKVGEEKWVDDVKYRITSLTPKAEVAVVGCRNKTGDLVIPPTVLFPEEHITFTVTSAADGAWGAFNGTMTSIKLPETCTLLNGSIFNSVPTLKTLYLPASLARISSHRIGTSLSALERIVVAPGNKHFKDVDGVLYDINQTILYFYPAKKDVGNGGKLTLPEGIVEIKAAALEFNRTLKELTLPASLQKVNQYGTTSFVANTPLATIKLAAGNSHFEVKNNVLYTHGGTELVCYPPHRSDATYQIDARCTFVRTNAIQNSAFLTKIDLNKVQRTTWASINSCPRLTTIVIPDGMNELPASSITNCPKLSIFEVSGTHPTYLSREGFLYDKLGKVLLVSPKAKSGEIILPPNTTGIGNNAFNRCTEITKITIPNTVTSIDALAFAYCGSLREVVFEPTAKITNLPDRVFEACGKLTTITIPKSVTTIGPKAFNECFSLHTVKIENQSNLIKIEGGAFLGCNALANFTFLGSSKLQHIKGKAFEGLPNLTTFAFPKSVVNIEKDAFKNSGLVNANFAPDALISKIGTGAFANCALKKVVIPSKVTTIESEAFKGCNSIENVTIPATTTNIATDAFLLCSNLNSFIVAGGNTKYSSPKGMLCTKDKTELLIFPPGQALNEAKQSKDVVLLPPTITKIGSYAFFNVNKLIQVTIPQYVTSIGDRAFGLCTSLKSITILCDKLLDPAKITSNPKSQTLDAFDNAIVGGVNQREKITIRVRKELKNQYAALPYYQSFNGIKSSFTATTNGVEAEYMPYSPSTVELLSVKNATMHTFVASDEVSDPSESGSKYKVGLISDFAFKGSNIKEVVIKSPDVYSLGVRAFLTQEETSSSPSSIRSVIFCANEVPGTIKSIDFEYADNKKDPFEAGQKIYVKSKMLSTFQKRWTKFASLLSDRIPAPVMNNGYMTFAREFDVDLVDGTHNKDIHAFVAKSNQLKDGLGDIGAPTKKKITFTSIAAAGANGTYIPANTGVLIKYLGTAPSKTFHYRIGEKDNLKHNVGTNYLKAVVSNEKQLPVSTNKYYVLQKSIFRLVDQKKYPIVKVPVHKAYLELGASSGAAELYLAFEGDDDLTTGVEAVELETTARAPYYRLDGTRVAAPGRGLYIHNGRKVFLNK